MMPKTFHRIFLDDPIPSEYEANWEGLKRLHPGWKFKTWDSSKVAEAWLDKLAPLWDTVNAMAGRTDILRYEIMAREGGIYVDTDVQGLKSFEPLVHLEQPFVGWESQERLCPTVLGSPKEHPAMQELLLDLLVWVPEHEKERDPVIQTGPIFLTQAWGVRGDVTRMPVDAFYPVGPTERKLLSSFKPRASNYSLHHWAKGWAKSI